MSFMLNCPCCDAKPSLELDKVTEWYAVTCWECSSIYSSAPPTLGSYRQDVDPAVCDWNDQVLDYLYKDGQDAVVRELMESLEAFPAWRRHAESGRGGRDRPFS